MRQIYLILISLLSLHTAVAQHIVTGVVFADKNTNGVIDKGEKGVKRAAVTNGDTIVWCSAQGRYSIEVQPTDYLSVILPDGFISGGVESQNGSRKFVKDRHQINFALTAVPTSRSYRMAIVGDPQVDNEQQFTYAQIALSKIAARQDLDGVIMMGDLVNDNVEDLGRFSSIMGQIPTPTWSIIGNHDITAERTSDAFIEAIGADVTAFFRGTTCFVLFNNVEGTSREKISEASLRFLESIASHLSDESLLVLCQHIPLAAHKQRERVLEVLGEQRTLILSAHAHTLFRQEWSQNIAEVSVGALCGHWWTGERGEDGCPTAIQQCGTPPNYFCFDFAQDSYSFEVQVVGDECAGGELYWSSEIDFDSSIEQLAALPARTIIANIYGSSPSQTTVEWSLDRTTWHKMQHTEMISPNIARLIYLNREGDYPSNVSRRQPLRKLKSKQIWSATLPAEIPQGVHTIYIRAKDSGGLRDVNLQRIISIQ